MPTMPAMPTSIDPSALSPKLAEAALQRQTLLIHAMGGGRQGQGQSEGGAAFSVDMPAPGANAQTPQSPQTPQPPPTTPAPVPPAPPAAALRDQVHISSQARQGQGAQIGGGAGGDSRTFAASAGAGAGAIAPSSTGLPPWPSTGVAAPLHALLSALVGQITSAQQPQRLIAAQPWPQALMAQIDGPPGDASLPPLPTWLVHQGLVHTEQGDRSFTATLRAPRDWLQALAQDLLKNASSQKTGAGPTLAQTLAQAAIAAPGGSLRYGGAAQTLQSGSWALVLQASNGPNAANAVRTSALLTLEFQPLLAAQNPYAREALARQDPWALMTALQGAGATARDEALVQEQEARMCQTPGCPYQGRAECEQPFCLRLRRVLPVTPSKIDL